MNKHERLLFLIVTLIIVAYVSLRATQKIPSVGTVKTIGLNAFWDEAASIPVTLIDWDLIGSGESRNIVIYLQNLGTASCLLSMRVENWNPPESQNVFSLFWSGENSTLTEGEILPFTLSLNFADVSVDFPSFGFIIVFEAFSMEGAYIIS